MPELPLKFYVSLRYFFRGPWNFPHKFHLYLIYFSDPSLYPSKEEDGIIADLAPPVFTSETKNSPKIYRKSVGESFQVSKQWVAFFGMAAMPFLCRDVEFLPK